MEKYSLECKLKNRIWIQDHINSQSEKIYKIHYIDSGTERSKGEYFSMAEARKALSAHKAASALGSIRSPKKSASSRENGKKGGRPYTDEFNEKFPVGQDFHTGLWGWRRVNGCIDLSKCTFRSRAAASRDRNQSNEKALFLRTGEICISL